jgi:hypothetical protein
LKISLRRAAHRTEWAAWTARAGSAFRTAAQLQSNPTLLADALFTGPLLVARRRARIAACLGAGAFLGRSAALRPTITFRTVGTAANIADPLALGVTPPNSIAAAIIAVAALTPLADAFPQLAEPFAQLLAHGREFVVIEPAIGVPIKRPQNPLACHGPTGRIALVVHFLSFLS